MSLTIALIYGSVRSERKGIRAVRFLEQKIKEKNWTPVVVDPLEFDLPLLDKMYKEYDKGQAPTVMEKLAGIIKQADAFVVVSAEYNHTMPPALINLMDHFLDLYAWRPSGIVTYSNGSFGGVRAGEQLRGYLAELGLSSIPTMLPIPKVQDAFSEDGTAQDEAYHRRAEKFLAELEWYAKALKNQKEKGLPQ